ncbi:ABC transporter permease [Isoptericola dokdonensis]|uniref:ABC-2 family transporter protein n=1 Tax=Isoptericola dokdonensis DS-3 TaxID=1300344 RepID=A0A161I307_9MICO|nr:ABC transporter permease [Isoptericola dokdonensis]ANC32225.1 ABC-2 family transporter protein [Isoptericola dokdonensis DS-3]
MTTLTPTPQHQASVVDPDGNRGAWLLVMQREIVVRALNKSFVIGLVVSIGVLAALAGFFAWQGSRVETSTVAVSSADTTGAAAVAAAAELAESQDTGDEIVVLEVADDDAARAALTAGDADAWLHEGDDGWVLTGEGTPDGTLTRLVGAGVETQVVGANAAAAGTSVEELSAGATLTTEQLDPGAMDSQTLFFASFALSLLFFTGAITSGSMIAGSVVEEKQSRLVEIIATAVPLRQLLVGKILGNSVIALAQNLLFAGVGLIAIAVSPLSLALPALSTSLIWFVVFFTVGFLALAALFAVSGALASRQEDLQHTMTPMMVIISAVYFVTFSASGTFQTVLSFVPLANVVAMPVRVLSGEASWWEPVVSLLLLAAFAVAALLVCERAFRGALLQTGGRVSWKQALRSQA